MPKVYLSPERRPNPHGGYWGIPGVYEHNVCCEIGDFLSESLMRCGFEVMIGKPGYDIRARVAEAVKWGADYYLPLHTNASGNGSVEGKAQGTVVLACGKDGSKSWKACQMVYDRIMQIYPRNTTRGVTQNTNFYEIINTPMLSVYPEIAFHDNGEDAQWIVTHKKDIANAICKGVCDWYGVAYVSETSAEDGYISIAEHQAALEKLETEYRDKYSTLEASVQAFRGRVLKAVEIYDKGKGEE